MALFLSRIVAGGQVACFHQEKAGNVEEGLRDGDRGGFLQARVAERPVGLFGRQYATEGVH